MRDLRGPRSLFCCLLAVLTVLAWGPVARAGEITVSMTSSQDSMIFQNNVNNSAGGAVAMYAGTNASSSIRRGLVAFDLAGNVPTGAIIDSVQLTLTYATYAGSGSGAGGVDSVDIGLYRLLGSWGEGTNLLGQGPGGIGQGSRANTGDVTWSSRFEGSQAWSNPGGDFAPVASATTGVGGTALDTAFTWTSSRMVADVQQWLNDPTSNAGWMLRGLESGSQTFRGFYTREEAIASYRPTLTVTYHAVPEPSSSLLALVGVAGVAGVSLAARRGGR